MSSRSSVRVSLSWQALWEFQIRRMLKYKETKSQKVDVFGIVPFISIATSEIIILHEHFGKLIKSYLSSYGHFLSSDSTYLAACSAGQNKLSSWTPSLSFWDDQARYDIDVGIKIYSIERIKSNEEEEVAHSLGISHSHLRRHISISLDSQWLHSTTSSLLSFLRSPMLQLHLATL